MFLVFETDYFGFLDAFEMCEKWMCSVVSGHWHWIGQVWRRSGSLPIMLGRIGFGGQFKLFLEQFAHFSSFGDRCQVHGGCALSETMFRWACVFQRNNHRDARHCNESSVLFTCLQFWCCNWSMHFTKFYPSEKTSRNVYMVAELRTVQTRRHLCFSVFISPYSRLHRSDQCTEQIDGYL